MFRKPKSKKELKLSKKGKLQDQESTKPHFETFHDVLLDVYKHKECVATTPYERTETLTKMVDKSYRPVGIHDIGGEGIILKATDEIDQIRAIKIALPYEQAKGVQIIRFFDKIKANWNKSTRNIYSERFRLGAKLQKKVHTMLHEENITFFSVPDVLKISGDPLYYEMPWIESVCIIDWLKNKNTLQYSLKMFGVLLDAIIWLHDKRILHRDLKSANIMMGKNNSLVILDWTLSKEIGDRNLTVSGTPGGTEGHGSPKMIIDQAMREASYLDDQFSLGMILWEFVAQRFLPRMHKDDYSDEKMVRKFIKKLSQFLPAQLVPIFLRATEIKEERRYTTVAKMKEAFDQAVASISFTKMEAIDIDDDEFDEPELSHEPEIKQDLLEQYLEQMCEKCTNKWCRDTKFCQALLRQVADMITFFKEHQQ